MLNEKKGTKEETDKKWAADAAVVVDDPWQKSMEKQ